MTNSIIAHHGIKGQKWGVRRFQNEDGTLTPAGKARENNASNASKSNAKQEYKQAKKEYNKRKLNEAETKYKQERKEVIADSKSKARDIRSNLTGGQKAAAFVLGGPFGSRSVSNYMAAGNSIGKAYVKTALYGANALPMSALARNRAAERDNFN